MTADELADELVTHFNDLAAKPWPYQAIKPDDLAAVEAELSEFGLFVIAKDERETEIDRAATCRRERVVSVVGNGPLTNTRKLADYLAMMEFLRTSLEGTTFGGYLWEGNGVLSLWDRDALKGRRRFLALFEATYYIFS